jgi:hypothetical protein
LLTVCFIAGLTICKCFQILNWLPTENNAAFILEVEMFFAEPAILIIGQKTVTVN